MISYLQKTLPIAIFSLLLANSILPTISSSMYSKLYSKSASKQDPQILQTLLPNTKSQPLMSPNIAPKNNPNTLLISTTINFRHGERTSSKSGSLSAFHILNCTKYQVLTPQGAMTLAVLGQRLFQRYKGLISSHSLFISSAKNRCLQSLLNFLQGFRDLDLEHLSMEQLMSQRSNPQFFKSMDISLLHECNANQRHYFEVSKKIENYADESGENDDLETLQSKVVQNPVFEQEEPALSVFKKQVLHPSQKLQCPWTSSMQQRRDLDEDVRMSKMKQVMIRSEKKKKNFYQKVLESILAQISFSKFIVLWQTGMSLFSMKKPLSIDESLLSEMCQNYAVTLNQNMLGFITGDVKDIKFCFFNPAARGVSSKTDLYPALPQKGIFVADKGFISF